MFSTVARKLGKVGHVVTFYLFSRIRKTLDLVKETHGSKRGGGFFCVCVCVKKMGRRCAEWKLLFSHFRRQLRAYKYKSSFIAFLVI